MGAEVYHALASVLESRGLATTVGDEGGFAPKLGSNADALEAILASDRAAGYRPGEDATWRIDAAVSELYEDGRYNLRREGSRTRARADRPIRRLGARYPIVSLEDGLAEDDWAGWAALRDAAGRQGADRRRRPLRHQHRAHRARHRRAHRNSILIKVNQIGSLTETLAAMEMAKRAGWTTVVSHRSRRDRGQHHRRHRRGHQRRPDQDRRAGRSERVAKYNQLLRIETDLGIAAQYPGRVALSNPPLFSR